MDEHDKHSHTHRIASHIAYRICHMRGARCSSNSPQLLPDNAVWAPFSLHTFVIHLNHESRASVDYMSKLMQTFNARTSHINTFSLAKRKLIGFENWNFFLSVAVDRLHVQKYTDVYAASIWHQFSEERCGHVTRFNRPLFRWRHASVWAFWKMVISFVSFLAGGRARTYDAKATRAKAVRVFANASSAGRYLYANVIKFPGS